MTLKAGTVCYLRGPIHPQEVAGHVVTVVDHIAGDVYEIAPAQVDAKGRAWDMAARHVLVPISDPDQPVDVTSDTDEPVAA